MFVYLGIANEAARKVGGRDAVWKCGNNLAVLYMRCGVMIRLQPSSSDHPVGGVKLCSCVRRVHS